MEYKSVMDRGFLQIRIHHVLSVYHVIRIFLAASAMQPRMKDHHIEYNSLLYG
jgi:hypothetical protein